MSHSHSDQEAHNAEAMAEIKKVTIILSVFTIVELILGFWMIGMTSAVLKLTIKGTIVILSIYYCRINLRFLDDWHDFCSIKINY